ncbi:hypothetical protein LWI28_020846 [Acer negundo]|uniref:Protein kinase domain-containing protein n=1 Tax=Acer negundo TaxID=4023 RepID=A0AAD5IIZ7_ACENE|nr:hypothetical protein LWI28_020846 [Acer negundo]KAK4840184.1 hypothetical protein QYF36_001793 [Acer negundo]
MVGAVSIFIFIFIVVLVDCEKVKLIEHELGPFNSSFYPILSVIPPALISNEALQITPDSAGNFTLTNRSGRVFFKQPFMLWQGSRLASFNSSFLVNIFRLPNTSAPGEGFAFLIAPDQTTLPSNSHGQFLGLTNSTTDGLSSNHFLAIELDTFKQDFDPDANHIGLDINSVHSNKTVSLSNVGIEIAPVGTKFNAVWVQYDGVNQLLDVYIAEQDEADKGLTVSRPQKPVLSSKVDLRSIIKQQSYFGFAASTGEAIQLNCVLRWNITVEDLGGQDNKGVVKLKIGLAVGIPLLVLLLILVGVLGYCLHKKRAASSGPNILGALKSLPGMPREFRFRDLKKATNNFDDKRKLGQGGFGVVYKGVLPKENLEIAVKKFTRDNLNGKDDFLAELTIINRLRHKHLVRLLGWCHKNDMLLLVYDYMPNGSLDNHLFCEAKEKATLEWVLRYKIISGVASALHYLHDEYDQKVVHRDLKASNIMLDSNFNARLGDFGLARALENEKTSYAELEGVPGTMGYIAPECFHTGKATCESDVYGFGAVLLELVCGQRPWTKIEGFQFLVDWVWYLHREGRILDAVDQRLGTDYVAEEAERLLLLGLACSHPIASERPKTQGIVQIISGSVAVSHVPPFKPPFVWPSMSGPSSISITTSMANTLGNTSVTSGWSPQYLSRDSYIQGEEYGDSSSLV